jgi:hypothetical protein
MHMSAQKPPVPSNKPKVKAPPKWSVIKLDYFQQNTKPGITHKFTLGDLAKKHGLSYGHVRNVAGKEGWQAELDELMKDKPKLAIQATKQLAIVNEIEVRLRQATISRKAIDKAIAALDLVPAEKLEVKDAINLLKLGLEQERKALGIPEDVRIEVPKGDGEREAVTEAMDLIGRLRERHKALKGEFTVEKNDDGDA